MIKPPPSIERLKSALDYDPSTGVFTWKHRPDMLPRWNTRYAGKRAGSVFPNGYRIISLDDERYYAQRLAWFYVTGEWPDEVDHRDTVRGNDWFSNLRPSSHAQNIANIGRRSNNTSGLKGVSWSASQQRWRACIQIGGKTKHLAYSKCPAAAHLAYVVASDSAHGEFARHA